ncbi:MAG: PQQ-like beta-propeller repeat protein [Spirochaetales bacterium]|nr:PQQ-like beta-propeller repeat protein [Spirochaetales bacterium]
MTKRRQRVFICIACIAFCATSQLSGEDWPRWLGPDGNSITSDSDFNPKALGEKPEVLWEINVGNGFSQLSITDGRGYTLGNNKRKDTVYCIDVQTGKTVWEYTYDASSGQYPGPRSTPTIDGELVYTLGEQGHLYCFKAKTGEVVWEKNLVDDFSAIPPSWGFASSCVIDGNNLLINALSYGLALDKRTGKIVWASPKGVCGYSTPVLYSSGKKKGTLIFGEKAVYGVDRKIGKLLWSYPWSTSYNVNAADPLYIDGKVFIASDYGNGCALLSVTSSKPQLVYKNDKMKSHFNSFVYHDGYLYGNDGSPGKGTFRCLEFSSGKEMWSKNLGFGALIAANGYLVLFTERGYLHIAELTHTSYKEVAKARVLTGTCWTPPVLAHGKMYCRNSRGNIVCIDVRKEDA